MGIKSRMEERNEGRRKWKLERWTTKISEKMDRIFWEEENNWWRLQLHWTDHHNKGVMGLSNDRREMSDLHISKIHHRTNIKRLYTRVCILREIAALWESAVYIQFYEGNKGHIGKKNKSYNQVFRTYLPSLTGISHAVHPVTMQCNMWEPYGPLRIRSWSGQLDSLLDSTYYRETPLKIVLVPVVPFEWKPFWTHIRAMLETVWLC